MSVPPGFTGAGVVDVHDALRLELGWWSGGIESPGQLGSVINACLAVASGLATHVLCFRSVYEGSAQGDKGRAAVMPGGGSDSGGFRASGFMEWTLPFAAPSAAQWIAMMAQRHFYEYGTTREQLAQIALNARKNAALNPKAIYTDPMTMEDYLGIRMITSPFCLYDCDAPVRRRHRGDRVAGRHRARPPQAGRSRSRRSAPRCAAGRRWDQFDDLTTMACRDAGAQLWTRTDLKPSDVQLAEMYDGFSFITMAWLEAMGFCGKGESGPFVEGGAAHRPRRRAPAEHARRAALGRSAPRLRVPARSVRAAVGRSGGAPGARRPGGRRRRRRWRTARRRAACSPAAGSFRPQVPLPGRVAPFLRGRSASSSSSRPGCGSRTSSVTPRTTSSSTTPAYYELQARAIVDGHGYIDPFQFLPGGTHAVRPAADHPPLTVLAILPVIAAGERARAGR